MKTKNRMLAFALAASLSLVGIGAIAASNFGSAADPLVSLSYLTEVLTPKLMENLEIEMENAVKELEAEIESLRGIGSFVTVTLDNGQTLTLSEGAEVLARSGEVNGYGAMLNITQGELKSDGAALLLNNLYLSAASDCRISAASDCLIMIRGVYSMAEKTPEPPSVGVLTIIG